MLGTTIKVLRMTRGIKQAEFAKSLGVSPTHMSLVESGRRRPSLALVERAAQHLRVPVGLLFSLERAGAKSAGPDTAAETEQIMRLLLRALEMLPPASKSEQ